MSLPVSSEFLSPSKVRCKTEEPRIAVVIESVRNITADIRLFTFARNDGRSFSEATAGSHVDFCLPGGAIRQYSLVIGDAQLRTYSVAVKKCPASRGGSRLIFDAFTEGTHFEIVGPRNHFPLFEAARHTTLIAGGIGVTPLISMAYRLQRLGRSFNFYYACRSADQVAFREDLIALSASIHIDEDRGSLLDLSRVIASAPAAAHLYCCGPLPMMQAFAKAACERPSDHVHTEFFSSDKDAATVGGFRIELARSKKALTVKSGQRIVDALKTAGINVSVSCEQGICGSCETRVLSGIPDHRDQVLTEKERQEGKTMMVCCSGSHSDVLVLDI
jgi:ferredoxin-NADP reductase